MVSDITMRRILSLYPPCYTVDREILVIFYWAARATKIKFAQKMKVNVHATLWNRRVMTYF